MGKQGAFGVLKQRGKQRSKYVKRKGVGQSIPFVVVRCDGMS